MGLLKDFYNGAMAIPSSPKPAGSYSPAPKPVSSGPQKLDLHKGTYKDESRFSPSFRFRVQNDLKGTLKNSSDRYEVANLFYQSRGGRGIDKNEIKNGLKSLVKRGKLTENQMWAVRKKYGAI
ncbi:MAG: hypothetical protein KW802_01540 [Candidatus Doudnabacteria bacterium]|nr:hypothetical protein [Candidatus Doudnabacteria bacterium]